MKKSIMEKIDENIFKEVYKKTNSLTEMLIEFGVVPRGGNYRTLKNILIKRKYCIEKFEENAKKTRFGGPEGKTNKIPDSEVFTTGTKSTSKLKNRYIKYTNCDIKCVKCGIKDTWNNEPLTLQLDHINGDSTDNRIENLRLLCPNCHSQTDTYARKNCKPKTRCIECNIPITKKCIRCNKCNGKYIHSIIKEYNRYRKVKNRPSKEELKELIENNTWVAIGKMYNVNDNSIRKWAKGYGLI